MSLVLKTNDIAFVRLRLEGLNGLVTDKDQASLAVFHDKKKRAPILRKSLYIIDKGRYGFDTMSLRRSIVEVIHKRLKVDRKEIFKLFFIHNAPQRVVEKYGKYELVEIDHGGRGYATYHMGPRRLPVFEPWSAQIEIAYDPHKLTESDVVDSVRIAGYAHGVGLHMGCGLGAFNAKKVELAAVA